MRKGPQRKRTGTTRGEYGGCSPRKLFHNSPEHLARVEAHRERVERECKELGLMCNANAVDD